MSASVHVKKNAPGLVLGPHANESGLFMARVLGAMGAGGAGGTGAGPTGGGRGGKDRSTTGAGAPPSGSVGAISKGEVGDALGVVPPLCGAESAPASLPARGEPPPAGRTALPSALDASLSRSSSSLRKIASNPLLESSPEAPQELPAASIASSSAATS